MTTDSTDTSLSGRILSLVQGKLGLVGRTKVPGAPPVHRAHGGHVYRTGDEVSRVAGQPPPFCVGRMLSVPTCLGPVSILSMTWYRQFDDSRLLVKNFTVPPFNLCIMIQPLRSDFFDV